MTDDEKRERSRVLFRGAAQTLARNGIPPPYCLKINTTGVPWHLWVDADGEPCPPPRRANA